MKLKDVLASISASTINLTNDDVLDFEIECVFASDLMSDCLNLLDGDNKNLLLLTGLANAQSLRTAEMLDLDFIVYVRAKVLSDQDIELAKENNINVFTTSLTMYETCGILYKNGLLVPGKQ